jgi:hypothetical protein
MSMYQNAQDLERFIDTVKGAAKLLTTEERHQTPEQDQALAQHLAELEALSDTELLQRMCSPYPRRRLRGIL